MSANNFGTCPQCKREAEDKVKDAYGKVSESEYLSLLKERNDTQSGNRTDLSEDWEIGIYDGVFEVSYSAVCEKCGFKFSFEHQEKV